MSIFVIKIIACITMLLDHIKYAIPVTNNFVTTYFGRISFPLFAFMTAEGYSHTKNLKRYYIRLFIFAIISQIPFMLFRTLVGEYKMLNILFTLILGLMAINSYDKIKKMYLWIPIVAILIYMGKILNVDYGWFGVATIFLMYVFKENKDLLFVSFASLVIVYFYSRGQLANIQIQTIYSFLFTLSPMIIILFYNGKKGKGLKWFFYLFYPIHMLALYLINYFLV